MLIIDPEAYYSFEEVAENIDVYIETVRRWIRKEKFPSQRIGRKPYISGENLINFWKGKINI